MFNMTIQLLASFLFFFCLPVIFFILAKASSGATANTKKNSHKKVVPKSYPLIGSYLDVVANSDRRIQWLSDIVLISPANTYILRRFLGQRNVITANPAVVQHILKSRFPVYQKGHAFRETLKDFLGNGIFNTDGDNWKFQRQVASHEFNTRSLRKFVENVVETELNDRLIPILTMAAAQKQVLDLQDILQRFAFDNICKIAFGFDPEYLTQSLGPSKFAKAFDDATEISSRRSSSYALPLIWKIQKHLNIGSERRLREAVSEVREFAKNIIREKKRELAKGASLESADMLSRFLSSGHSDEEFVADIVISFILAGKDTTSAALTWFFWLLSKNPEVEKKIVNEAREKSESPLYDEVKDMIYTHAALSESMRLYPPVPMDAKEVMADDVLPDGTMVRKGMMVTYHVYAMGRMEKLWGDDWAEYKPERWLEREGNGDAETWRYVARDSYSYPVFQAGPRICLGKEMAYLQMKKVVGAIVTRFRVVPAMAQEVEPQFVSFLTSKMKGGFPVKIHALA
ncbi:cytochrome P450 94A1-like [Neltuma alba]|uniref:cytochrome P450 94A1-like n=1 Tax=Neltuma alba TaxID=207710 RepID=UPI0010A420B7|nr:cytochrome P450 94A1-like [Prosopis alba]